jgi:hypothetical protein
MARRAGGCAYASIAGSSLRQIETLVPILWKQALARLGVKIVQESFGSS